MATKQILLAFFGTGNPEVFHRVMEPLQAEAQAAFPDWDVSGVFTSTLLAGRIRQAGIQILTVTEALCQLPEQDSSVAVQPVCITEGRETQRLRKLLSGKSVQISQLEIGAPLLSSESGIREICRILAGQFPKERGTALVLMGHGTCGEVFRPAARMESVFQKMGRNDFLAGAMEGSPGIEEVLEKLRFRQISRVKLIPLLNTVGYHAANDLAGDAPESWKNRIMERGYAVKVSMKGLGEYPEVRARYLAHLKAAISRMEGQEI